MIRSTRTTAFVCGEHVTLKDLRDIVEKTKDMPGDTKVKPQIATGQRDSQSYSFVIEEAL